jgi:hypothetical protein
MLQINCHTDNPFGTIISRFFQEGFPSSIHTSKADIVELLTEVLIGTKETRYGPVPNPESLVRVRQTIRKAVELDAPIPMLVPWGGRKRDDRYSIDTAEISAVKQIVKLNESIKQFFSPGLHIHIALEDLGAEWLFKVGQNDPGIEDYSGSMVRIVDMLKGKHEIEALRESAVMDRAKYFDLSHKLSYMMEPVVQWRLAYPPADMKTFTPFQELRETGWLGEFPIEQVNYYMDSYAAQNPSLSREEKIVMLCDYMAGAKARYDLDGKLEPDSAVGSYIKLSFTPPIPGSPEGHFNNTLYWRTIPYSNGRTHIAPWRSKGFLKIDRSNKAMSKLASFRDPMIWKRIL